MDKTTAWEATPDEIKQYRAEIDRYVTAMEEMQQHIAANRSKIQKSRVQTQAILAELKQHQQVN